MPTRFRPYQPKQMLLLSPDLRKWVPEGHLAHQVSELVDGLDLGAFYQPYEEGGRGNAPYEPRMMVKVLIYAYAAGVFSSRKIAKKLEEDVAFRMLASGNFPQHRTICEFRRRHLKDFKKLFVEVVSLAREMGMVWLGRLSINGTKVRANASRHKAMSYGRMREQEQQLKEEIEALLKKAPSGGLGDPAVARTPSHHRYRTVPGGASTVFRLVTNTEALPSPSRLQLQPLNLFNPDAPPAAAFDRIFHMDEARTSLRKVEPLVHGLPWHGS